MRESPTYRTNLQQLNERFVHEELTISEVAAFIGKSKNTRLHQNAACKSVV